MDLRFENAWILYLLWLVPAAAVWWYFIDRRRERALEAFVSREMQGKLRPPSSSWRFLWQLGLAATGLLLMLIACARPQWGTREERVLKRGRDLIMALDVSRSMLANDIHPSRLQRAKIDLMDLIKDLGGDRAGLIAFRRKAALLCPLTTDYSFLRQTLDAVGTYSAPPGETDIGDALVKSIDALESDSSSSSKAIILISDGEDLMGKGIEMARKAAEKNIPIFTVGLGSSKGSLIPEVRNKGYVTFKGENVITKLDDESLHTIARTAGGVYIPVGNSSMASTTLGTLYREHLRKITAKEIEDTLHRNRVERYQVFLLPGIILLMACAFLSRGRLAIRTKATLPAGKTRDNSRPPVAPATAISVLLVTLLIAGRASAQTTSNAAVRPALQAAAPSTNTSVSAKVPAGRRGAEMAQALYAVGKFQEAADAYKQAAEGASGGLRSDLLFNAAASLYRAGKFKEAANLLEQISAADKTYQSRIDMGYGTALYRAAGKTQEEAAAGDLAAREENLHMAGNAFAEAARFSGDKTASDNLNVVLGVIPEAEEQARIAKLMEKYGKSHAADITEEMLVAQRKLVDDLIVAYTNEKPDRIKKLENISARQKANAELWIPLKGKLAEAMSGQPVSTNAAQQIRDLERYVETSRDSMNDSAAKLRDLDPDGYRGAMLAEPAIYRLWKGVAPFQLVLREDLRRQTNVIAVASGEKKPNRPDEMTTHQTEALNLTDLFAKRFAEAVPEGGLPAQPAPNMDTNAPAGTATNKTAAGKQGITAEDRKKILDLTAEAGSAQEKAIQLLNDNDIAASLPEQRRSHDILKEIEKLLPKDSSRQQQENKEDQQEKSKPDQSEQENPQEEPQKVKPEDTQQKEEKNEPPEDIQRLLEKALQREKEHEAEKRQRTEYAPPVPSEKDW